MSAKKPPGGAKRMKYGKRKKATKEANYRKYSKYKKAPGGGGGE